MPETRGGRSGQPPESGRDADADLARLRELLVGPEKVQLTKLQERLDEDRLLGEDVARVLPEAVRRRDKRDEELARSLRPVVEKAVHASVRRDPQPFAEAIFPVIGPAIKRAIAEGLKSMVARLESVLEQTLSFRRQVLWRIEAARTGRPLAEVALSHALRFRVEQAFLIHAETGLLLSHAAVPDVLARGQDVVAGMLTAIRDFVRDSFEGEGAGPAGELDAIQLDELSVLIERGRHSVIAAVVRGVPDPDLRGLLRDVIGDIEISQEEELEAFDGDPAPFEAVRPELERCLVTELRETGGPRHGRIALVLLAGALLIAAVAGALWGLDRWREGAARERAAEAAWRDSVARIDAEPGYVVTEAPRGRVNGLRDPFAREPAAVLADAGLDPGLQHSFESWSSPEPSVALRRARSRLAPPDGVELSLEDGVLIGRGRAGHRWIEQATIVAPALPGIEAMDASGLVDADAGRARAARERLESASLTFGEAGSTVLDDESLQRLRGLAVAVRELSESSEALRRPATVEIHGHSDSRGDLERNVLLSRARAESVHHALVAAGAPAGVLRTVAQASLAPVEANTGEEDLRASRRVTFRVLGVGP